MTYFFLALLCILASGFLPLFLIRLPALARLSHLFALSAGCLAGGFGLVLTWNQTVPAAFTCTWLEAFSLSLRLDALSAVFLAPVLLLTPIVALYGSQYLKQGEAPWRVAANRFFFSLLVVAMILVPLADSLVSFALAWELMSLSSYLLVLYEYEHEETRSAATLYLVFTQTGALLVFAAFGLLVQGTGSMAFAQWPAAAESLKLLAFLLALVGFGSKAGVAPLHIWLPHAHPAAPSHVSALMSGVMIKMGIYGILRLAFLLQIPSPLPARTVLVLGLLTGVLGVLHAVGKNDLKRLLAYSSVENIGIICIGCGLGLLGLGAGHPVMTLFGLSGAFLHILNHALFKSLLFMGAGAVMQQTGQRRLDQLGGLMRSMPGTGRAFLVGSVAISGLPPLNGFISECLIYYAAFQGLRLPGLDRFLAMAAIIALALIGGLACACFTKVVGIVFCGTPRQPLPTAPRDPGAAMRAAMFLLACGCVAIGLWPEPWLRFAAHGLNDLGPVPAQAADQLASLARFLARTAWILPGSTLLLAGLRWLLLRRREVTREATWGCGFTRPTSRIQYTGASYARELVELHRPFVRATTTAPRFLEVFPGSGRVVNRVEDWAEVALQRLLVAPMHRLTDGLRWIQHGYIQLYIGYIVLTIVVLLLVV